MDDLILFLQRWADRLIRWLRLGRAPSPGEPRFLIIQVDGLSRAMFDRALASGHLKNVKRLLDRRFLVRRDLACGIPTSTPAFQAALMYGVYPDIPGFHWYDKRLRADLYVPRPGVADLVERRVAAGRRGIMEGGACYGCVFTGGASDNLWTFARITRPDRAARSLVRMVASAVVLVYVIVKCVVLTMDELARAVLGFLADPLRVGRRGIRWLLFKIGLSIWLRQFFTLATSADLYRGVRAIYVNFLEYDVFAHAFGPEHSLALRALRGTDRSVGQLWRVLRRVSEHRYDVYVLSDHGMAPSRPFVQVSGGVSVESVVLAAFSQVPPEGEADLPRLAAFFEAYRRGRGFGPFQRYINYMEADFARYMLTPERLRALEPIRVVASGPNAFVYFTDSEQPLGIEAIEARFAGAAETLSRHSGVGFVLARSEDGPVCWFRGKRFDLGDRFADSPFAGRPDRDLVIEGLTELMRMPSAGDLVIYGIGAPGGHVSFLPERGAHAGPAPEELHTFLLHTRSVALSPEPLTHPARLYPHFLAYAARTEAGR